ncbi:MAG: glutamate--tRNA ligase [bacterium]
MSDNVRTRFAPSPTGDLHVGGARTALFCWLFSQSEDGDFLLRIEDTDFDRSANKHTEQIIRAMKWLGLDWEEGPEVGGPHEPYYQSQRIERYEEVLQQLKDEGRVYKCYCTKEELDKQRERQRARKEPPRYSGRCRKLSDEERQQFEDEGRDHTWRYRIPQEPVVVEDIVQGDVSFPADQVGDFIIVKSNGTPSYNFAVVVDDYSMDISHVIRGDDHLSNTPRQIYLYNALGWDTPKWCHLPMILGEDGSRLSKRHGATDVEQYREQGFLPEAMLNALALLGWSPPDGVEVKSIPELIDVFELERINASASQFDFDKVKWLNGQHLRDLPAEQIVDRLEPFMPEELEPGEFELDEEQLEEIVEVLRDHLTLLTDFSNVYTEFFKEPVTPSDEAIDWLRENPASLDVVEPFCSRIEEASEFDIETVKTVIGDVKEDVTVSGRDLYLPMRIAITGKLEGPEFHEMMPLLGKQRCLDRVNQVLDAVGKDAPASS